MKKILFAYTLFLIFIASSLGAKTPPIQGSDNYTFKDDAVTTLWYIFRGSYLQFQQSTNLPYLGLSVPTLWYSFKHDKRISSTETGKKIPKHIQLAGDLGVAFSFPIVPLGFYFCGRVNNNRKISMFAMEYFATIYLTLAETGILSHIPVHRRPSSENISFWEKSFRGSSSFPSGHVVPYAALFFKTFQYFGPYYAILPGLLFSWASMERMRSGKHYLSDVLGSFFLTAFASEGVRAAANYQDNHPVYKWLFEHQITAGLYRHEGAIGPYLSWNF